MRQKEKTDKNSLYKARQSRMKIGGQPVIELLSTSEIKTKTPKLISATILPGRGMNIYQLKAFLPGKGLFDMFTAPPVKEVRNFFNNSPEDFIGNNSFKIGGAILIPYPNRIRGNLLADGKSLETKIMGKPVILPANWSSAGNTKGEKISMHGLILKSVMNEITLKSGAECAEVTGILNAGDFDGRWIGQSKITTGCVLSESGFSFSVTVENTGKENVPMGIGWHPYFNLPSGKREQAVLKIPAKSFVPVNNYDDVFPTGEILPVKGTKFDFSQKTGAPLKNLFMDDCFTDLEYNSEGNAVVELTDPAAGYGVRITANNIVKAIQIYSPVDKNFVAIEPQLNLTDPFNEKTWGKNANKGMEIIKPGQSIKYEIKVELFSK